MDTAGIYSITNRANGKVYVGSAVDLRRRLRAHKSRLAACDKRHCNAHLQRAWDKYGADVFEFTVLEYVGDARENYDHLIEREQYWLDFHRMFTEVYNSGPCVANPFLGRTHTPESKDLMRQANTGRKHTPETRARIGAANEGHVCSDETRAKISAAKTGRKRTSETCAKMAAALAKPYPAFVNRVTGETIPTGVNLRALCRKRNLNQSAMRKVVAGTQSHHKDWTPD